MRMLQKGLSNGKPRPNGMGFLLDVALPTFITFRMNKPTFIAFWRLARLLKTFPEFFKAST